MNEGYRAPVDRSRENDEGSLDDFVSATDRLVDPTGSPEDALLAREAAGENVFAKRVNGFEHGVTNVVKTEDDETDDKIVELPEPEETKPAETSALEELADDPLWAAPEKIQLSLVDAEKKELRKHGHGRSDGWHGPEPIEKHKKGLTPLNAIKEWFRS